VCVVYIYIYIYYVCVFVCFEAFCGPFFTNAPAPAPAPPLPPLTLLLLLLLLLPFSPNPSMHTTLYKKENVFLMTQTVIWDWPLLLWMHVCSLVGQRALFPFVTILDADIGMYVYFACVRLCLLVCGILVVHLKAHHAFDHPHPTHTQTHTHTHM